MAGMLLNNALYYLNINRNISYTSDFVFGNSIITIFLLYVCSYIFKFCIWHRIIITANLINIFIAYIDIIVGLPVSDIQLLTVYYVISVIFMILATVIHINQRK